MSDVSINIEARDRVSATLDSITNSVGNLIRSLDKVQGASINTGNGMKKSAADAGKAWSTMGKGLQTVGGKLTSCITKPAIGAATGLAGITLKKGFSRMLEIDTARAKLNAMIKDTGKVSDIMEKARNAVGGTAFGFDEAATVAASATAAGVKQSGIEEYLKSVGAVAAVAGTSFSDMGAIYNKIMANGKVSAEEWNQLTDRGVDIQGALAQSMGKSKDEILQMRSAGEITADDFTAAMQKMYGGAAQEIGKKTISGNIANIGAAISRIGENFLKGSDEGSGFASKLLPLLVSVREALGMVEGKAKELGDKFGDMVGPAMDKLTVFFKGIANGSVKIDAAKAKFAGIAAIATTALGPAFTIAGKAMAGIGKMGGLSKMLSTMAKIGPKLLKVGGPIGLIVAGITAMMANSEQFRSSVGNLFSTLLSTFQTLATALAPIFQSLLSILGPVLGAIGDLLAPLVTVLGSVIEMMASKIATVAGIIAPIMAAIASAVGKASAKIQALGGAWNAIKAGSKSLRAKVSEKAKAILDKIKAAWDKIKEAVKNLSIKVPGAGAAKSAIEGVKKLWDGLKSGTKTLTYHIKKFFSKNGDDSEATGTRSAPGGLTLVGERGPELVNMPKGASVHTARETEALLNPKKGMQMPMLSTLGSGGSTAAASNSFNVIVNMTNTLATEGKSVDQIISELSQRLNEAFVASAEGVA